MAGLGYVCLLMSLSFHEAAHSIMADRCGDPTGRLMGRSSLNPLPHIDPLGTVILPLVMMFTNTHFLFGWAKPVPFNPRNLRDMRRDSALIGLAGPLANLALAITFAILMRIVVIAFDVTPSTAFNNPLFIVAFSMVSINLVLMLFNLIPVPPLDGGHLLHGLLPLAGQQAIERIGPFGLLFVLLFARPLLSGPLNFLWGLVLNFAFWGQV